MTVPNRLVPERPNWELGSASIHYTRLVPNEPDNPDVWALTIDTGSTRVVTFWDPASLESLLRKGLDVLGVMPDGLLVAGPDDLGHLKPPGS